jgi:aquaporin Z
MNPARTAASALPGQIWTGAWVYFTAPLLGMVVAAEIYRRARGAAAVLCCKLHHDNDSRCIFRCRYH